MSQDDDNHPEIGDADASVQALAIAGYAKVLAEGPTAELDHETRNCMLDMAVAGRPPFEDLDTYLALYPASDRDKIRKMILKLRDIDLNRRSFTVQPGDTVMVAKDRELPHDDPNTLSDFIPCRTEDAVPATVIGHDAWWLSFRMPDGTTDRVLALSFKSSGQCSSGGFRAHPRHDEFREQGIFADYPAPRTRVFHVDVFQEVLRKEKS